MNFYLRSVISFMDVFKWSLKLQNCSVSSCSPYDLIDISRPYLDQAFLGGSCNVFFGYLWNRGIRYHNLISISCIRIDGNINFLIGYINDSVYLFKKVNFIIT